MVALIDPYRPTRTPNTGWASRILIAITRYNRFGFLRDVGFQLGEEIRKPALRAVAGYSREHKDIAALDDLAQASRPSI